MKLEEMGVGSRKFKKKTKKGEERVKGRETRKKIACYAMKKEEK